MKISKYFIYTLAAVVIMITAACSKNYKNTRQLEKLVEKVNVNSGTQMPGGMILTKCEYHAGDTVFTYFVKAADEQFEKVSTDDIKNSVLENLSNPKQYKLVETLVNNNIDIQYVFETNAATVTVGFSSEELNEIITLKN